MTLAAAAARPRLVAVFFTVLSLAAPPWGHAQRCNLNPNGPDQLSVLISGPGSDFDLGWTGERLHDFEVPEGRFDACLKDCDTTTDPLCTVEGYAGQSSVFGRAFLQPFPLVAGTVGACIVSTFREPYATGTANVSTGEVDVTSAFSLDIYVTSIGSSFPTNICPVCSAAEAGGTGTCVGGATPGAPCTTSGVIDVNNAGDGPYALSRDCLPSGTPQSTEFTMHVTTGESRIEALCPGQTTANACTGTCNAECQGSGDGGGSVSQTCCSDDPFVRCFPTPVVRRGVLVPSTPAWPDPTYPKAGTGSLVGTFCLPATPLGPAVNDQVGLPGPGAFVFPVEVAWLVVPCSNDAECADGDACTQDSCDLASASCSNTPIAGASYAAILCRLEALIARVAAETRLGKFQAPAKVNLEKARPRLLEGQTLCSQPNAKKARKRLQQAGKPLSVFVKRLSAAAARRALDATLRNQFVQDGRQLQSDLKALRSEPCPPPSSTTTTTSPQGSTTTTTYAFPRPDLVPTAFALPDGTTLRPSQSVTATWTVANQGPRPANPSWYDGIHLSTDDVFSTDDVQIGGATRDAVLAPSGSYDVSGSFFTPFNLVGNFYLFLRTDAGLEVIEGGVEGNNVRGPIAITIGRPDLIPTAFSLSGGTAITVGTPVQANFTVRNQGNAPAAPQWIDRVYISLDTIWEGTDQQVGSDQVRQSALDPAGTYDGSVSITISGRPPGTYFLILRTDSNNNVPEGGQTMDFDNNFTAGLQITLVAP